MTSVLGMVCRFCGIDRHAAHRVDHCCCGIVVLTARAAAARFGVMMFVLDLCGSGRAAPQQDEGVETDSGAGFEQPQPPAWEWE
ncbi:hypothetical protein [Sphingomonas sp. NIC1]|uniref:hypothetical protein n=1 Tax=Sphingomonas sp. NIC1 TaxID=1961362 RepID=UPI00186579E4|nr:hypothetical protein [Sphingomonas sp. NIC1]